VTFQRDAVDLPPCMPWTWRQIFLTSSGLTAVATCILAVGTCLLAYLGYRQSIDIKEQLDLAARQLLAMNNQVTIAQKQWNSMYSIQRPYVYANFGSILKDKDTWHLAFTFGNNGNTPARNLAYHASCSFNPSDVYAFFALRPYPNYSALGAKDYLPYVPNGCILNKQQMDYVIQGGQIFVFALAIYEDS
jgi:hypothetical protein